MHNYHDQAHDLRQLVRDSSRAAGPAMRPALLVVASGKGGTGTTTVAVNLAIAWSRQTHRVLLVDADPQGGSASFLCNTTDSYTLADVLAARRSPAEVIQDGPAGMRVLPGVCALEQLGDCSGAAVDRLIGDLSVATADVDLVLVDAGNGLHRLLSRFWQAADMGLLVTTPEAAAIMNTYALAKLLCTPGQSLPVHCLVNGAADAADAASVQERMAHACQRFLGFRTQAAGYLPDDDDIREATRVSQPYLITSPHCRAALEMERIAERLAGPLLARRGHASNRPAMARKSV